VGGGGVVGVDTGGTFTDVFASGGTVVKVPSTPDDPVHAILGGLRLAGVSAGDAVGHGTTVATNAILERKGARTVLVTTAGFEDVLEIRRQNRPSLYDLYGRWPDPLVPRERRLGLSERLDFRGIVMRPLDAHEVRDVAVKIRELEPGAIAISLLFAYANSSHERQVREIFGAQLGPELPQSLSHEIAPQFGEFERTSTTVANAYVTPLMRRYLEAVQTVLSGPAAGVVGARAIGRSSEHDQLITFDMGGTSTDIAVVPGEILESGEGEVANFPLLLPMLTIETVGAGGGSIARVDAGGGLHVGPESAGAVPGPAAYGQGVEATVTDAHLLLGRLSARGLLGGAIPLHKERAHVAVRSIAQRLDMSVEHAAWAIIRLANSNMDRAVRSVTLQRGYDPRRFTLFPFGGAGPLHAAELAEALGIERILVPPHPGVMAALGLTVPDLRRDFRRTVLLPSGPDAFEATRRAFHDLEAGAGAELGEEDLFGEPAMTRFVDMRYTGQSFELRVPYVEDLAILEQTFAAAYEDRYGYRMPEGRIEIVHVHLRATMPRIDAPQLIPAWPEPAQALESRTVYFNVSTGLSRLEPRETRVLWRPSLDRGVQVSGPAIVEQYDSATVVPPGWVARVDHQFNLEMSRA
jgi:N-methylhydantoinase A